MLKPGHCDVTNSIKQSIVVVPMPSRVNQDCHRSEVARNQISVDGTNVGLVREELVQEAILQDLATQFMLFTCPCHSLARLVEGVSTHGL